MRVNTPTASMITVFNSVDGDPQQTLRWNREVKWHVKGPGSPNAGQRVRDRYHLPWSGTGTPWTIYDAAPGEHYDSFRSERLGLRQFINAL